MIIKYEKVMQNIIAKNSQLSRLNYICNGFVLNEPDLNQIKNKILSPAIISLSESQHKLLETQITLLEEIKQLFTGEKYRLINQKFETEQAKLEGELSVIKKELKELKKNSKSVTTNEIFDLFVTPTRNVNTANVDATLVAFQEQQKFLYDKFKSKNGEGKSIEDLNKEMNKLTEFKKSFKKHIDLMISTLL